MSIYFDRGESDASLTRRLSAAAYAAGATATMTRAEAPTESSSAPRSADSCTCASATGSPSPCPAGRRRRSLACAASSTSPSARTPTRRCRPCARSLRFPAVVAIEDPRALLAPVNSYLGLVYAFVGLMLVFGAVMAFALLFAAMASNLAERSVELATLRAAGIGHRELARMLVAENALVVAAGIVQAGSSATRSPAPSWPPTAATGTASSSTCAPPPRRWGHRRSCSSPCSPSTPGLGAIRRLDVASRASYANDRRSADPHRRAPPRRVGIGCRRDQPTVWGETTTTGHGETASISWATLPSSTERIAPRPRVPRTR